ncbi:MAG TPA: hypothetical protein VJO99_23070, partial [Burkholderiaceae bacterium]|nr:hypothetical protein [Burkholderiaceae bacterium]
EFTGAYRQLQQNEQTPNESGLYQTNQQLSTRCAQKGCTCGDVWIPHQLRDGVATGTLRNAAANCRECPLGERATQTVWGKVRANHA